MAEAEESLDKWTSCEQPTKETKDGEAESGPLSSERESQQKSWRQTRKRAYQCRRAVPEKYPRCCACIGGIILPLFLLIALAFMGGGILAGFEAPAEYSSNDAVLANYNTILLAQALLNKTVEQLMELPEQCLNAFLQNKTIGDNATYEELMVENVTLVDETILVSIADLQKYMRECGGSADVFVSTLFELRLNASTAIAEQSLTFNWIRCWDEKEYGTHKTFFATNNSLTAAAQQSDYYTKTWESDQQRLQQQYIADMGGNATATSEEIRHALAWSLSNATGKSGCSENLPGSAWFFFTVMTTIGYGNQSPVTAGGRWLTFGLGFFFIIAFGAIVAAGSQILTIVLEDLATRWKLRRLNHPVAGMILWSSFASFSTLYLGTRAYTFWTERLPETDQPYADKWDSMWFAYITTTTVGLGDYFLQPAYIFGADVFSFSLQCLSSFVFFAALLGKIVELASGSFPDFAEKLRSRVARTNYTNMEVEKERDISDLIKMLRQLIATDGQDSTTSDPTRLAEMDEEAKLLSEVLTMRTKQLEKAREPSSV